MISVNSYLCGSRCPRTANAARGHANRERGSDRIPHNSDPPLAGTITRPGTSRPRAARLFDLAFESRRTRQGRAAWARVRRKLSRRGRTRARGPSLGRAGYATRALRAPRFPRRIARPIFQGSTILREIGAVAVRGVAPPSADRAFKFKFKFKFFIAGACSIRAASRDAVTLFDGDRATHVIGGGGTHWQGFEEVTAAHSCGGSRRATGTADRGSGRVLAYGHHDRELDSGRENRLCRLARCELITWTKGLSRRDSVAVWSESTYITPHCDRQRGLRPARCDLFFAH